MSRLTLAGAAQDVAAAEAVLPAGGPKRTHARLHGVLLRWPCRASLTIAVLNSLTA
jgi:hypothetical protein